MKTDSQAPVGEQQCWIDRMHQASQDLEPQPAAETGSKRHDRRDPKTGRYQELEPQA